MSLFITRRKWHPDIGMVIIMGDCIREQGSISMGGCILGMDTDVRMYLI